MGFLKHLLLSEGFMPHGFCYLWNPRLIWLHVVSDGLIFAAYQSILFTLIYFVRRRRDLPFRWMFWCFGAFIVSCGFTRGVEIWTLWHADYWLSGGVKAVTAVASVLTAILLVKLVPQAVALPRVGAAAPEPTAGRPRRSAFGGGPPLWLAYGVGAVTTAAVLLVIEALGPEATTNTPVIVFLIPIIFSAYLGGLFPGLVSTALAAGVTVYFTLVPVHSWGVASPANNLKWVTLMVTGALISVMSEALHRAGTERAREQERGLLLSTERKVRIGFAVLLACLIAIAAVSYPSVVRLRQDTAWVEHTHEVLAKLRVLFSAVTDAENGWRGYVITGQEEYLEPYQSGLRNANGALRELHNLTADNAAQQSRLDALAPLIAERLALLSTGVELRRSLGFAAAQGVLMDGEGKQLDVRILGAMGQMEATEQALLREREARAERASLMARMAILAGSTLAVVLVTAALFLIGQGFRASRHAEAALREARGQLEDRVTERTAELALTNERLREELLERKRAEEVLRESEERFRALVTATSDVVYRMSPDWSEMRQLLGRGFIADTEAPSRTWLQEYIYPDEQSRVMAAINEAVRTESIFELEHRVLRVDGSLGWTFSRAVPIKDTNGQIVDWFGTATDITERKRAEESLSKRTEDLARSNADLERFAYVASHDLQEPLRMVASFTQLLAKRYRGKLDADADEFIGYAVDGARRMQALINDLLTYSRVGTRGKKWAPTSCEAVLEAAQMNLKNAIEETGGVVTHDPLPTVQADETQLRQVFQNLVGNALKFHGSAPPRVHVSAQEVDGEWRFSVRDDGIGIDPQYAERIFVIFQRLHTEAEYPGTGIGLAISKKIVERHGGRIWVESAPGHGATFYFTLGTVERAGEGQKSKVKS
jgi:signal transduction histidine kinase